MAFLAWWRGRNDRWARANLTVAKHQKLQKNWAQIERLGTFRYFVFSILGMAAWVMLVSVTAGYFLGTLQQMNRQADPGFLKDYLFGIGRFSLMLGIIFSVFYYIAAREGARLRPADERM